MPDREPIHGICPDLEQATHAPDYLGLHEVEIPDPTEVMLKELADKHNLDRTDPEVASVLARIGELKREFPDNPNVALREHHHIQTLLVSKR